MSTSSLNLELLACNPAWMGTRLCQRGCNSFGISGGLRHLIIPFTVNTTEILSPDWMHSMVNLGLVPRSRFTRSTTQLFRGKPGTLNSGAWTDFKKSCSGFYLAKLYLDNSVNQSLGSGNECYSHIKNCDIFVYTLIDYPKHVVLEM